MLSPFLNFIFKNIFLATPHGTWDLSSPITALALEALSFNHWTTKEVSISEFYTSVSDNHNARLVINNLFFHNKVFFFSFYKFGWMIIIIIFILFDTTTTIIRY